MGVVAAGTGQHSFWPPGIFNSGVGVTANRMSLGYPLECGVATGAEFVYRFVKLKAVVCCVGAVADGAASTVKDTVDVIDRAVFFEQRFFVGMAGDTESCFAVGP